MSNEKTMNSQWNLEWPEGGRGNRRNGKFKTVTMGMPLHGKRDPYRTLYEQFRRIPKQGFNVNFNELKSAEDYGSLDKPYLNYEFLDADDKKVHQSIAVAVNQPFL